MRQVVGKDLFGFDAVVGDVDRPATNQNAKQSHETLLKLYGSQPNKCKNCAHFLVKQYSGTYFKCLVANPSGSGNQKTDWRANWTACGKFKPNEDDQQRENKSDTGSGKTAPF